MREPAVRAVLRHAQRCEVHSTGPARLTPGASCSTRHLRTRVAWVEQKVSVVKVVAEILLRDVTNVYCGEAGVPLAM